MVGIIASFIFLFCFSPAKADLTSSAETKQNSLYSTYIVSLKKPSIQQLSTSSFDLERWYQSFLPVITTSSSSQFRRMVYSYSNVFTGFAAKLTAEEVKAMETREGFVSAHVEKIFSLHTTHSPDFLGLHQNYGFWKGSNFGKGVIIGVLDTGITPGHPSFTDKGMPPPPAKWKGKCEFNGTVCNNKLIGARNFVSNVNKSKHEVLAEPPFDKEGHGTHIASTAGGNFVKSANVFDLAGGTAVGMAPLAHLAMYKVCGESGCAEADILAAMDTAIGDGVDVLSLSLGVGSWPFYMDSIAVGAFNAMRKGIFVSCSAGNEGPVSSSLSNEAPWILTVGASTIDRSIVGLVELGNGATYAGESLFHKKNFTVTRLSLVYAGANGNSSSAFCTPGSLQNSDVEGKIVLCERGGNIGRVQKGQEVKDSGGVAMILMNDKINGYSTIADSHVLPAAHVSYEAGTQIKHYINTTSTPTAAIRFMGTVIGRKSAPEVTSFSSRGPNLASPGILKPDITGPGVSILAAWPVSLENDTNTRSTFNIVSGTSMSCPHLSGIAALIKSSHPNWSPAAIKSAIMTTADIMNLEGKPIMDERLLPADIYAVGAGHVNPSRANNPGLVYDIQPDDYIPYLCGLNYTDQWVEVIVQRSVKCSNVSIIAEAELNYPSFSVALGSGSSKTYTRTVTYVGEGDMSFVHQIVAPEGVDVSANIDEIFFTETNQKVTYAVTFTRRGKASAGYAQGYLYWVSDQHTVRSPFVVF